MNYDQAKADVFAMVPEMGDLYVRTVDNQLLEVRYSIAGIVIMTYGLDAKPSDSNVRLQRWTLAEWIAAVTTRAMRRATPDDVPDRERIVFAPGTECWRAIP